MELRQPQDSETSQVLGPRVIYFSPADIQIPRVDRNCIVKFCEALQQSGARVTLISTRIRVLSSEPTHRRGLWDVFGVRTKFHLVSIRLPLHQKRLDSRFSSMMLRATRTIVYPPVAAALLMREGRSQEQRVLYAKNYGVLPGLLLARHIKRDLTRLLFEVHVPPKGRFARWLLQRVDGVVCNSRNVELALTQERTISPSRSIAVHQGFAPDAYPRGDRKAAKKDARLRLNWRTSDKIVVYTGKVYWKYAEIDTLLQSAALLAPDNIRVIIVGGRPDHVEAWTAEAARRELTNATFVGLVPPTNVPDYQVAADVLVSCYPSGIDLNDYRSPGKLFEYMASGTPIVAADYPSLREVLANMESAMLVKPDDPGSLAAAIHEIVNDPSTASRLGERARRDVQQYTWASRADRIRSFVLDLAPR